MRLELPCATLLLVVFLCFPALPASAQGEILPSSEISSTAKPWTRWWWMGSAVDRQNITRQMIAFDSAGLGGVEIEPIYGVQGEEKNELDYLSSEWNAMLDHAMATADSLGMQLDFTLGTGWPYGGPHVSVKHAATRLVVDQIRIPKGEKIEHTCIPQNPKERKNSTLLHVLAFSDSGAYEDLTEKVNGNLLLWKAKKDDFTIYFVYEGKTGQQVKRAAPGGAGFTLDHYSQAALNAYVQPFEKSISSWENRPRAIFNDSYEVYGTDFTPGFFEEFERRRGYDLKQQFHLLMDSTDHHLGNRVKSDYRETLGDLLLEEFNRPWTQWANDKGMKTKLQAHGAPGNLIDLYASADIPECETFGSMPYAIPGLRRLPENIREGDADPVMLKFSSSAAHIAGRPLVSSETFTWLRDHFKTALSQCKPEADDLLLNGVNHIFLHGSTYSPERAEWPGWKFYASVNFNPNNSIWEDAPALFRYLARCQSLLQSGRPDNETLLYWPIYDVWDEYLNGTLFFQFKIHSLDEWLHGTTFYKTTKKLMAKGYGLDFISDRFVEKATVKKGKIILPGGSYKSLVVPDCEKMPLATLQKLLTLKKAGAHIIFEGWPESVPGFHDHEKRTDEMAYLIASNGTSTEPTQDVFGALAKAEVHPETLVESGLKFIRRDIGGEKLYFLVNHTAKKVDTYLPLGATAKAVAILDPLNGNTGTAAIRKDSGAGLHVRVQIPAGASLFLKTGMFHNLALWKYYVPDGPSLPLTGEWQVNFIKGGPHLPESVTVNKLESWTSLGPQAEAFSGTARYTIQFQTPQIKADAWQLNLGDIRESAKVWLNGDFVGTAWSLPFSLHLPRLKPGKNKLTLEVTNLPANRIRAK
ncbi:MAG TPA: glycosyl hydrolase, partial [Pricia sp.]|nr:glycosyl hydrolase [Pricia sp.]